FAARFLLPFQRLMSKPSSNNSRSVHPVCKKEVTYWLINFPNELITVRIFTAIGERFCLNSTITSLTIVPAKSFLLPFNKLAVAFCCFCCFPLWDGRMEKEDRRSLPESSCNKWTLSPVNT